MNIGIDIIDKEEYKDSVKIQSLRQQCLTDNEQTLTDSVESTLAIIATKEALMKAGVIEIGKWKEIEVFHEENGAPYIVDLEQRKREDITVSISHSHKSVVSVVLYFRS